MQERTSENKHSIREKITLDADSIAQAIKDQISDMSLQKTLTDLLKEAQEKQGKFNQASLNNNAFCQLRDGFINRLKSKIKEIDKSELYAEDDKQIALGQILPDILFPFRRCQPYQKTETAKEAEQNQQKEQQLFWQQQQLRAQSAFLEILTKINVDREPLVTTKPKIYFIYAWPLEQYQLRESGVQPFLQLLHDDLMAAGIEVVFDKEDSFSSNNLNQFMGQILEDNCIVLVFGTESFRHKWFGEKTALQFEGKLLHLKWLTNLGEDKIVANQGTTIIPWVLTGIRETAIPDDLLPAKNTTIRALYTQSYIKILSSILSVAYSVNVKTMEIYFSTLSSQMTNLSEQKAQISSTNQAIQLFLGDGKTNGSHLEFNTWYHPEICHYLAQLVTNNAKLIRVVFHDTGDDNTITFKKQLRELILLSNYLDRPAIFIGKEPGSENHFIVGIVKYGQLLFVNPLGATQHSDCYQTFAELVQEKILNTLWFTTNVLQRFDYEEKGLVSCGPIVLELVAHVLSTLTPDSFDAFWKQLEINPSKSHTRSGLHYQEIDIQDLLPKSLQKTQHASNYEIYKDILCNIRQHHYHLLQILPVEYANSNNISIDDSLQKCKDEAPSQVLFNALITESKTIITITELPECQLLVKELGVNYLTIKNESIQRTVLVNSNSNIIENSVQSSSVLKSEQNAQRDKLHDEEAVKQKLVKRIPDTLQLGAAIGKGDCFFDAMAQSLNVLKGSKKYTAKSLRLLCDDYVKNGKHTWVKETIEAEGDDYEQYLVRIPFTVEELEEEEKANTGLKLEDIVWGRPEIEGRMICKITKVKLHVIGVLAESINGIEVTEQLIDAQALEPITTIEKGPYDGSDIVHLVNYRNHFVPLLDSKLFLAERSLTQFAERSLQTQTVSQEIEDNSFLSKCEKFIKEIKETQDAIKFLIKDPTLSQESSTVLEQQLINLTDVQKLYASHTQNEFLITKCHNRFDNSLMSLKYYAQMLEYKHDIAVGEFNLVKNYFNKLVEDFSTYIELHLEDFPVSIELYPYPVTELQEIQAQALFFTQRYVQHAVQNNQPLGKDLLDVLRQIKAKLGGYTLSCFISYALPIDKVDGPDRFIQPFLEVLSQHLLEAGIYTLLDFKCIEAGQNLEVYMKNLITCNHWLLIGTPSLTHKLEKHAYLEFELKMEKIRKSDTSKSIYPLIPIVLLGDPNQSFPHPKLTNKYLNFSQGSYLSALKHLLKEISHIPHVQYNQLWAAFETNHATFMKPMDTALAKKYMQGERQAEKEEQERIRNEQGESYRQFVLVPPQSSAVSIPSSLVKGDFAEVIKEKIKQGANANSQYQSLLEKSVNPLYKDYVEFLKEEMRRIRKGTSNDDFQGYLSWLEKNYAKIDHRETSGKFEEAAIDLYIREEREAQIKYWNVPKVPPHFIGRESLLEHLAQRLNQKESQIPAVILTALHGLGGIGKTFLAARYAQLYAENYSFILWFNAVNETTLTNDYRHFADAFHLPIKGQSPENIITIVKSWLEQQSNWLIIYDNAPDDKLIAKFKPAKGGKVLITSRKDAWSKKDSLSIDVFSLKEARNYIVELTGFALTEHQAMIDELAENLGYLPLALAQACAYISVNHLSLEDYLKLYIENRTEMLADETMPAETSHEPVAVTWNITFKVIEKQQPAASALLESCAFLQGNSIPEFLLKELFAKQQPALAEHARPFIDSMRCLQQYNMLKPINQEKEKAFNLHNLVQEVIFDNLSNDKKRVYLIEIVQLFQMIFPQKEVESLEDYIKQRYLLPHLERGLQRVEEWLAELKKGQGAEERSAELVRMIEKELCIPLLVLSAYGYRNLGNARKPKELLEQALVIQEQHYGKDHPKVAAALNDLATAYRVLGKAHKQRELLEQALEIQVRHFGIEHLEMTGILNNLAAAYGDLGKAHKQRELLEQALEIQKRHYGVERPEVAATLNNLAAAYGTLGDAHKQKKLLEQALEIQKRHYGADHPAVAVTLNNLTTAYGALGEARKQKELLKRALMIQEQCYGKEHPKVARTLSNLANVYGILGDAHKKRALLEQVLVILERYYGKDHPEVARILANLAVTYGALGDAHKQRALLEQVLVILERYYGKDHPEVACILANLAVAYGALGDAHKQRALLEQVLVILEQYYGKDHPEVALTLASLANAYGDLGEARQKKELLERALMIQEQRYGKDHPEVAIILVNLSNAYGALGSAHKQKELLEWALVIQEQHYGKEHLEVARILNNLANAVGTLGDVRQQKKLLERALEILEKYYRKNYLQVAITLNNLASVCASLGEWSIAKIIAERAYHIFSTHFNVDPQHSHTQAAKAKLDAINEMLAKSSPDLAKALRNAANQNNVEKLKELLPQMINVNAKDEGQLGRTALHWAVIKQALPCIKLLLAAGADAMMVDNAGKSSVDYAEENPIPDVLFLLLSHQYKLPLEDIEPGKLLRRVAHQNKANDVKFLLKHIKNVNEKGTGNTQRTALHWAVIKNALNCVEVLIAAGADPYLVDGQGKTAYDYAAMQPDLLSVLNKAKKIVKKTHIVGVPERNKYFIERENLLGGLAVRLQESSNMSAQNQNLMKTILSGDIGVGKTQLAIEFIYREQEKYHSILWVNAENKEEIEYSYADIAKELRLNSKKSAQMIEQVQQWIVDNPICLLIYDNASDYQTIKDFLPESGAHIIVTTRNKSWLEDAIDIDIFSAEEANAYIVKSLESHNKETKANIDLLAKTLGNIPLVLAQACANIKLQGITIENFLALYKQKLSSYQLKELSDSKSIGRAFYPTLDIFMDALSDDRIKKLLSFVSYLFYGDMPLSLLDEYFRMEEINAIKADELLSTLQQYSLINRNNKQSLTIHPLLQNFFKSKIYKNQNEILEYILIILDKLLSSQKTNKNIDNKIYLAHIKEVIKNIDEVNSKILNYKMSEPYNKLVLLANNLAYEWHMLVGGENAKPYENKVLELLNSYYANLSDSELVNFIEYLKTNSKNLSLIKENLFSLIQEKYSEIIQEYSSNNPNSKLESNTLLKGILEEIQLKQVSLVEKERNKLEEKERSQQQKELEKFSSLVEEVRQSYKKLQNIKLGINKIGKIDNFEFNFVEQTSIYDDLECILNVNKQNKISKDREIFIDDLFITNHGKTLKRILIGGEPGIGKSILCQYIAYKWSIGELFNDKFSWVFYFSLKTINKYNYLAASNKTSILREIIKSEFPFFNKNGEAKLILEKCLNSSLGDNLVVLDGYNEVEQIDSNNKKLIAALEEELMNHEKLNIIITTRPDYLNDKRFDRKLLLRGLDKSNINHYIKTQFPVEADAVITLFRENPELYNFCNIPLNLSLFFFKKDKITQLASNLKSACDIYKTVINEIFNEGNDENLLKVKFLAFETLKNGNIYIDYSFLGKTFGPSGFKIIENNPFVYEFDTINQNFATKSQKQYYFIHQNIQEYLAASYIAESLNVDDLRALISNNKYNPIFQQVWYWLSYLAMDDSQKLNVLFDSFLDEPRDLAGIYEIKLFIKCLNACQFSSLLNKRNQFIFIIKDWLTQIIKNKLSSHFIIEFLKGNRYILNDKDIREFVEKISNENSANSNNSDYDIFYELYGNDNKEESIKTDKVVADSAKINEPNMDYSNNASENKNNISSINPDERLSLNDEILSILPESDQFSYIKEQLANATDAIGLAKLLSGSMLLTTLEYICSLDESSLKLLAEDELQNKNILIGDIIKKIKESNNQTIKITCLLIDALRAISIVDDQILKAMLWVLKEYVRKSVPPIVSSALACLIELQLIDSSIGVEISSLINLHSTNEPLRRVFLLRIPFLKFPENILKEQLLKIIDSNALLLSKCYSAIYLANMKIINEKVVSILIKSINYNDAFSPEARILAIKTLSKINLADFLQNIIQTNLIYSLIENSKFLLETTPIDSLINLGLKSKIEEKYIILISKQIFEKNISVVHENNAWTMHEGRKKYVYKTDKNNILFFVKIKLQLKALFGNLNLDETNEHSIIQGRLTNMQDDINNLKFCNNKLDEFITLKKTEAANKRIMLNGLFKNLDQEKQNLFISRFKNNKKILKLIIDDEVAQLPKNNK